MLDLSGMTLAQKMHVLKWGCETGKREAPVKKRDDPNWRNNQSEKRKALDAAKKAARYSMNNPYWMMYREAKLSGKSHRESWHIAEAHHVSVHGENMHGSAQHAKNQYYQFMKYNNLINDRDHD